MVPITIMSSLSEMFLTFILVHVLTNSCTCISNDNDIVVCNNNSLNVFSIFCVPIFQLV